MVEWPRTVSTLRAIPGSASQYLAPAQPVCVDRHTQRDHAEYEPAEVGVRLRPIVVPAAGMVAEKLHRDGLALGQALDDVAAQVRFGHQDLALGGGVDHVGPDAVA